MNDGSTEILTVDEVAQYLKMSRSQIYSMTSKRGTARMETPIPRIVVNGNLRFLRKAIDEWIQQLSQSSRVA